MHSWHYLQVFFSIVIFYDGWSQQCIISGDQSISAGPFKPVKYERSSRSREIFRGNKNQIGSDDHGDMLIMMIMLTFLICKCFCFAQTGALQQGPFPLGDACILDRYIAIFPV